MADELFDKSAEQSIIGAILLSPESMHELEGLGAEDFASEEWRALFVCCVNLWQRGEPISNISLLKEFERVAGKDLAVAISQLIGEAVSQTVTASNISMLSHTVRSLAVRRRAISTLKGILDNIKDTSQPLDALLDQARLSIDQLNWLPSASRVVLFRDGIEIGGKDPIYEFNVVRPSDLLSTRIRINSGELDKRSEVRRAIRERLHFNPRLPSAESWEDFVHNIVSLSKQTQTPEALEEDQEIIFWIREWFKTATPAEDADDLINGYVDKNELYYIQPQRLLKWLNEHAKVKPTIGTLWAVLARYGARRDVSIRIGKADKATPRKLWGIPADFMTPTVEEYQGALTPEKTTNEERAMSVEEPNKYERAEDIDLGDFED